MVHPNSSKRHENQVEIPTQKFAFENTFNRKKDFMQRCSSKAAPGLVKILLYAATSF